MTNEQPKDPIYSIRKDILGVSQTEFAALAGVEQSTVSRWESGQFEPTRAEMRKLRAAVIARGLPWDDTWFFDGPPAQTLPNDERPQ